MKSDRSLQALIPLLLLLAVLLPAAGWGISVPDSIILNKNGALYDQISFDHARHIRVTKECSDCHHHTTGTLVEDPNCIRCHRNSGPSQTVSCRGCHTPDPFSAKSLRDKDHAPKTYHLDKPGLKGAMHQSCVGCHTKSKKGPTTCTGCHPRSAAGDAFYNTGEYAPKPKAGKSGH